MTSISKIDQPDFVACSLMENSIGLKRVNYLLSCVLASTIQPGVMTVCLMMTVMMI